MAIREYLQTLFVKLWDEAEGFNDKRPWGNIGWQNYPVDALVKAGIIEGTVDEEGYAEPKDWNMAHAFMIDLIYAMCAANPSA